jgi:antitoxin PrlF
VVQANGSVNLQRADDKDTIPAAFLDFLAKDLARQPRHVRAIDANLAKRMRSLTKGVKVDLENAMDSGSPPARRLA